MQLYGVSVKQVMMGVVFLLICGLVALLGAQNRNAERSEIVIAIANAPITLDPKRATDATSVRLLRLVGQGLVRLDDSLTPQPALASDFVKIDDANYVFTVPSVRFSNGKKVTPALLKAYYEGIVMSNSPIRGLFDDISRIDVYDDKIRFNLSTPNPWFWEAMALPVVDMDGGVPHGSGGFEVLDVAPQSVLLRRVADGQKVRFLTVKDPMVRVLKLMQNEVDVVHNDIPVELVNHAEEGVSVLASPSASYTYMGFLMDNGATADVRVRKAVSMAIDRGAIIDSLLGGYAGAADSLLQPAHGAFWRADVAYNPKRARALLAEAGYADGLALSLSITTNPFVLRVAQVLQQQLAEVGIHLSINSSEWGTFYGNIKKGNFDAYILTWVGNFTPEIYNSVFHSAHKPPMGANRGRYDSAEMDALLDDMMAATEVEQRYRLVRGVQKLQHKDMVYVPLWRKHNVALVSDVVRGYTMPLDGGFEGALTVDTLRVGG